MRIRISPVLQVAGVVGGVYSAGFLFGYNYHASVNIQQLESAPSPVESAPSPSPSAERPHPSSNSFTLATNAGIYKHGLPIAGPTLHYTNHVVLYDQIRRIPRWVAQTLTQENLQGEAKRQHSNFRSDPNLPAMWSSRNEDFKSGGKQGLSRGHMAAAADSKSSQEAMDQTFFLSNILPQNYQNNAGFWNRLEMYCRDLTSRWEEVHVISGPVMRPEVVEDPDTKVERKYIKYQVLGDKEVAVPTHLYKVILCQGRRHKSDNGNQNPESKQPDVAMGSFLVPNEPVPWSRDLVDFQIPLHEAESHAGLQFYPKLDRLATTDLCEADSCKLIQQDAFQLYIIGRQLENAKTKEQVDAALKKLDQQNLQPDEYLTKLLERKRQELGVDAATGG